MFFFMCLAPLVCAGAYPFFSVASILGLALVAKHRTVANLGRMRCNMSVCVTTGSKWRGLKALFCCDCWTLFLGTVGWLGNSLGGVNGDPLIVGGGLASY